MPGAVELIGEVSASPECPLSVGGTPRKRKGLGRCRKGKRRLGGAGEGVPVGHLENGALHLWGYGGVDGALVENGGVWCAVDEAGTMVNGVRRTRVHDFDINALPEMAEEEALLEENRYCGGLLNGANFVDAVGGETVKLVLDTSSAPGQEMELKNGWDADAHVKGDAPLEDSQATPVVEGPKKRRRLSGKEIATDVPLRRSSRRAATATLLSPSSDHVSSKDEPTEKPDLEKKCSVEVAEEILVLPPSSKDLALDGLPVLDIFSVYSCLRSFSTLLFLSPFSLKAFLAALKCDFANSLMDSVHYSILQALKPHLEGLSEEGCQVASDCLRNLNWELLDIVNWPLYLAEYLLVRHSVLSSGLKLLNGEYYQQPAAKKLEVLRNLCDDFIEIEVIRSELDRRILESEVNVDTGQNIERKVNDVDMSELQSPFSSKEALKEASDGNSDECCLCRMDGSLICCDGCPAAFHSRCVGMASDLLPEGEWFCPECQVAKVAGDAKAQQPFHGAEILGIDPYGRIYFGCCGYLLVSESSDMDTSYRYYNKDDLGSIIELFKSSYISYAHIIFSILNYWGIPMVSTGSGFHVHQEGHVDHVDIADQLGTQMVSCCNEELAEGENMAEKEQDRNSTSSRDHYRSCTASESCEFDSATKSQLSGLTFPCVCPEGSAASIQVDGCTAIPMIERSEATCSRNSADTADADLSSKCSELRREKHNEPPNLDDTLLPPEKTNRATQLHLELGDYVNCYSFGRFASSVAEELSKSSGDIKDRTVSAGDIVSTQLRAIYKKSINRYWSAIQKLPVNALKESCGWCFACKSADEHECLMRIIENKVLVGSRNRAIGLHSKDNRKSHILSVAHHVLHIEDNIHGLLCGPWQNPHHKRQWRKAAFKATDVTSLKYMLLTLELHLRRIALSAEWTKAVDSNPTVGSASYILTSERGVGRKHGRKNILENKKPSDFIFSSVSKSTSTPGIYWWRGGRLSRQIFHWKMLPRSLASKGGRQAGCRKIPGVLYPEGSEFAKRSKYVAWRAAVEMSQNVPQLTYQVKDLDLNIRWNDLSSNQPLPQLAKDSRKSSRPTWKATICEKCVDGAHVKYLLDFGKRKSIPDVVTKHGLLHKESSTEGKKFWLDETHIPINHLKAFEVRRLEQMRTSSEVVSSEGNKSMLAKPRRKRGFSDLLSRDEKSVQSRCGHCDKIVLEREEAVNCQFCKGLIHKQHFRVSKGAVTTTYTCYACKDNKFLDESKVSKVRDEGKNKKFASKIKGKKSVDRSKGKKFFNGIKDRKLVDGAKGRKSVIGKKRRRVDEDEKILPERIGKRLADGCKGKKESVGRRGKIINGFKNKKSMDGTSDKIFVNEFEDKRTESRTRKRKIMLGKSKILVVRKSERLAKKKQQMAKTKKRKAGCKRAKQSRTRKDRRMELLKSKDEISWPKRQRTGICPPYWLNGLLWTRKAYDERAIHFRETRVHLPFPNSKDNLRPVCSLCHKEYDSHVIYVGCDNCGEWFHGDAFALTLVNINNIRGFKCHRCRIKSTPVCPYSNGAVDEVNLLEEKNRTVNHLNGYQRHQRLVYNNQDLLHGHDYSDVVHSLKFRDEDKTAISVPDSGQILTAISVPDSGQILTVREGKETALVIGHTDQESLLVTEAEHSCVEQDEIKVIGEDHPL